MNREKAMARFEEMLDLKGAAEKTKTNYFRYVNRFLDYVDSKDTKDITIDDVQDFLIYLTHEYDYAIRTYNVAVYSLINFYEMVLHIPVSKRMLPAKKPEKVKKHFFDGQQARQLLNDCPDLQLKAAIALGFGAGLRSCEIVKLRFGDINKYERILVISQSKGNKTREVKYNESIQMILNKYILAYRLDYKNPNAFLFPEQKKPEDHLKSSALTHRFKDYIQAFRFTFPDHSFHGLRHAYATELAYSGVPLPAISEAMGHTSAATTAGYIHEKGLNSQNLPDVLKGDKKGD